MGDLKRRELIKGALVTVTAVILSERAIGENLKKRTPAGSDLPVVINAGVSSNNTVDLLARVDADCIAQKPGLTVLLVGTNDMNSQKYVPPGQYQKNLEHIIEKLKEAGSRVLLMTIPPLYEPYLLTRHPAAFYQPEGVAARRRQLNESIVSIARKQRVQLLDLGGRLEILGKVGLDKDSLFQNEANTGKTDGVHPTPTGYRFIALTVYDHIINHQLPTDKIVCLGDSITLGYGAVVEETYPAWLRRLLSP